MLKLISVKKSSKPGKKLTAVFEKNGHRFKQHFGASGYQDFTMHKDEERRLRYIRRHRKDLRTNDPTRAGYLSLFILWGETPNLKHQIELYKRKLKTYNKTGQFPIEWADQMLKGGSRIPEKYLAGLSAKDRARQAAEIKRARRAYKKGVYIDRPKVQAKRKQSKHVTKAKNMYNLKSMHDLKTISRKTGCSISSLKKILKKRSRRILQLGKSTQSNIRFMGVCASGECHHGWKGGKN